MYHRHLSDTRLHGRVGENNGASVKENQPIFRRYFLSALCGALSVYVPVLRVVVEQRAFSHIFTNVAYCLDFAHRKHCIGISLSEILRRTGTEIFDEAVFVEDEMNAMYYG